MSAFILGLVAVLAAGCTARAPVEVSVAGPYFADPPGAREPLEASLAEARARLTEAPDDPERLIWVGRRLGYLWRMREAIAVYSAGIEKHPDYAPLYRHRGHRYISVRNFPAAIADLERAARLIQGRPDVIEADGQPNERNIPLTTLGFNVWYHLGLARFLSGDYEGALAAYRENLRYAGSHDDNLVAVTYWTCLTLWRLGRDEQVAELLEPIHTEMRILENDSYHRLTLLFKGVVSQSELQPALSAASPQDAATLLFGLANWKLRLCDAADATLCLWLARSNRRTWPAFGHIAAEADWLRLSQTLMVGRL